MLERKFFDVLLDPEPGSEEPRLFERVEVRAADELRAELEARVQGIPDLRTAAYHTYHLWVWAAMVRLGHYQGKFKPFVDQLIGCEVSETPTAPPDPTQPAASADSS